LSKRVTKATLAELSTLVEGRTLGESDIEFTGVSSIASAETSEIGVLIDSGYLTELKTTEAGALIVSETISSKLPSTVCRIVAKNPREAVSILMSFFDTTPVEQNGVHPTAVISPDVVTGVDFYAGPYVVLEKGVTIGDGVRLYPHSVILSGAQIGSNVVVHPHVVVYPDVRIGSNVKLFAGARIGVDGFGYTNSDEGLVKIPHVGGCILGDDVEVGANTCIDRGSLGTTEIQDGVKIDNLVHIAHNVIVGKNSQMAAQVGVAGSTKIGPGTMWGGQSGAAGHLEIGDRTKVAAKSGVTEDTLADSKVAGFPSRSLNEFLKGQSHLYRFDKLLDRIRQIEKKFNQDSDNEDRDEP
jgi:UDP-3-O-[3-hydroxymyristoyl] glucosamine N-acyltransferase